MAARLSLLRGCFLYKNECDKKEKGLTTIYSLDKIKSWKPLYINGIADVL